MNETMQLLAKLEEARERRAAGDDARKDVLDHSVAVQRLRMVDAIAEHLNLKPLEEPESRALMEKLRILLVYGFSDADIVAILQGK